MTYVWRVENCEGVGPYARQGLHHLWQECDHTEDTGRPGPYQDSFDINWLHKILDKKEYIFGFKSLEQLRNWFSDKELMNLAELGYEPKQILAKEIHEGEKQVIFVRAE